jgi:phenylalanyl-tRNA synthetase beta chain
VLVEGDKGAKIDPSEALVAVVPAHRRDIAIEADVAEEVIRVRGYEELAPRLPDTPMPAYRDEPSLFTNRLRDALAGQLRPVLTTACSRRSSTRGGSGRGRRGHHPSREPGRPITLTAPLLLPASWPWWRAMSASETGRTDIRAGRDPRSGMTDGPVQTEMLGLLMAGDWRAASWAEPARPASLDDLKGVLEALVRRFTGARLRTRDRACWS